MTFFSQKHDVNKRTIQKNLLTIHMMLGSIVHDSRSPTSTSRWLGGIEIDK